MIKRKTLEKQGKLQYSIAKDVQIGERVFIKGHKKAITDFQINKDGEKAFSVSKDCCILEFDLPTQSKSVFALGEKFNTDLGTHSDEIFACTLSKDSRLLATGGKDKII